MRSRFKESAGPSGNRQRAAWPDSPLCRVFFLILFLSVVTSFVLPEAHGGVAISTSRPITVKFHLIPSCKAAYLLSKFDFGDINPLSMNEYRAAVNFMFSCTGNTLYTFSVNMGRNEVGGKRRMRHTTKEIFIPYNLLIWGPVQNEGGAKYSYTGQFIGILHPSDFANAAAGDYRDTLTVTITPYTPN